MRTLMNHHVAQDQHVSLPDSFIRRVLGDPKRGPHAVANARAAAVGVEQDREWYAKPREERLAELLRLCLPHVKDAFQGRGDPALEKLIDEALRAPQKV